MARLNFRVGWFRIELLPKFNIVYDVRRRVGVGKGLGAGVLAGLIQLIANWSEIKKALNEEAEQEQPENVAQSIDQLFERVEEANYQKQPKSEPQWDKIQVGLIAGFLSLVFPGLGQLYRGRIVSGFLYASTTIVALIVVLNLYYDYGYYELSAIHWSMLYFCIPLAFGLWIVSFATAITGKPMPLT